MSNGLLKVNCPFVFIFSRDPIFSVSDLCVSIHDPKKSTSSYALGYSS